MQICNACRYCEGFCAVFPAMTRRLEFGKADIHYLANLCHNCGACLHACQYAPPHEFAVNVPQAMAQVRGQTYADYAWPPALGALYQRNGLTRGAGAGGRPGAVSGAGPGASTARCGARRWPATSTRVFPHNLLVGLFAPVFLFAVLALGMGVRRFWRDVTPATSGAPVRPAAAEAAARRAAPEVPGRRPRRRLQQRGRRLHAVRAARFHHLTFYGFMLCFAATSVATLYHYAFGWHAPYDLASLPKLLGIAGGIGLLIGHGRAVLAESAAPPAARRCGAEADGPAASSRCCCSPAPPAWRCGWRAARRAWPLLLACTWAR